MSRNEPLTLNIIRRLYPLFYRFVNSRLKDDELSYEFVKALFESAFPEIKNIAPSGQKQFLKNQLRLILDGWLRSDRA